jgi:hypothetical protein
VRQTCVVLLAVVGLSSVAAPVPKPKVAPNYFPCTLGSKWEYAKEGEKEASVVVEVTAVDEKDGGRLVTFEHTKESGWMVGTQQYRVAADGVFVTTDRGKDVSPPRMQQRATPKARDEWECPHTWNGFDYEYTVAVGEEEKVTVPAGEYATLPHTQAFTLNRKQYVFKSWDAAGVGTVKMVGYDGTAFELLKFTPGK